MDKLVVAALVVLSWSTLAYGQVAVDHEEVVGPFPSWANVKTDFGAIGDGSADDTEAFQKALDTFQQTSNVLFLPAGVYRITRTLTMTNRQCLSLLGEDPARTVMKWDGADEGTMLLCNGVCYAKFARITWNGSGKSVTAIFHESENTKGVGTGNEHSDQVFVDLAFGIRAGKPHFMDAETGIYRCKFLRCSQAGVRIQSFNSLDWFIWDSEFEDCALGVTNDPGAGHFHVYRNIFRNSTVADIALRNAGYFGIRHNLSLGSKRFFEARDIGGWAVPLMLQGNTVLDTMEPISILVSNAGPTLLLDNVVRSRPDVREGPVVRCEAGLDGEYFAAGNTFTVAAPFRARHVFREYETKVVASAQIVPPVLPGAVTPAVPGRLVLEVAPNADGKAIQAAIDAAAAARGNRPIVHLPKGDYLVGQTIAIPAGLDVQIVGDGLLETTRLRWNGPDGDPMFALAGPPRATFRDCSLLGNGKGMGIVILGADQRGARIGGDGLDIRACQLGLLVDGVEQTDVSFRNIHHSGNKVSFRVVGGPAAAAGKRTAARTVLFGGASSGNDYAYDVANGGRLMAQDIWYEGAPPTFLKMTGFGTFTLSGAMIASGRPGPNAAPTDPDFAGVALVDFRGHATFLSTVFGTRVVVAGKGDDANVLLLGVQPFDEGLFVAPPPTANVALLLSRRYARSEEGEPPTRSVPDYGRSDAKWITSMLEQVRKDTPRLLTPVPANTADVRFYRVSVCDFATGIHVTH